MSASNATISLEYVRLASEAWGPTLLKRANDCHWDDNLVSHHAGSSLGGVLLPLGSTVHEDGGLVSMSTMYYYTVYYYQHVLRHMIRAR